jgi:hypothetical protein
MDRNPERFAQRISQVAAAMGLELRLVVMRPAGARLCEWWYDDGKVMRCGGESVDPMVLREQLRRGV